MQDVFIAREHEDALHAVLFLAALGRVGIWSFSELSTESTCVVALWSRAASASERFRSAVRDGHLRGVLVQAVVDDVELPIPYNWIDAVDLRAPGGMDELAKRVAAMVGKRVEAPSKSQSAPNDYGIDIGSAANFFDRPASTVDFFTGPVGGRNTGSTGHFFISHSTKDGADKANALVSGLETQGRRCWIAPRDVKAGVPYPGQIVSAIEASSALVLLVTPQANLSKDVLQEIQIAHSSNKTIVPIIVSATAPAPDLRYYLEVRHQIPWTNAQAVVGALIR